MAEMCEKNYESGDEDDEFGIDDDDLPLDHLFQEAHSIYNTILNDTIKNDNDKILAINRVLIIFEKINIRIRSNGMFSPNEEIDDINSSKFKYLLIDFYRGKLFPKQLIGNFDPCLRLKNLKKSKISFFAFLLKCENLKSFLPLEKECYDIITLNNDDNIDEDDDENGGGKYLSSKKYVKSNDPNRERSNKIERFKYQKDQKKFLVQLQSKKLKFKNQLSKQTKDLNDNNDDDDEEEMIKLHLCINEALDEILGINQELTMLEMMTSRMNTSTGVHAHGGGGMNDARMNNRFNHHNDYGVMNGNKVTGHGGGSIVYDAHDPNRPGLEVTHFNKDANGVISSRKEQVKSGVFQPGHRLPTMSLEEFADIEVKEAMERAARQQNAPPPPRRIAQLEEDGDEDDAALVDQASYLDRNWDDFKDANPKGSGNKANKRC